MKKNNENQIISFRKYIFAVSVIFTSLLCFNHIKASTFECAETVSFCVKTEWENGSGNCAERLTVCNKYKEDVLKCEEWVNGFDMQYREWYQNVQERVEYCAHDWRCRNNGHTPKGWFTPANGKDCPIGEEGCYYYKTVSKKFSTYDRVDVKVCSRWDINVKFGNATIDKNLIEY